VTKRIHLTQNRVKRLTDVEILLERTMSQVKGNLLTRRSTTSFSKNILHELWNTKRGKRV